MGERRPGTIVGEPVVAVAADWNEWGDDDGDDLDAAASAAAMGVVGAGFRSCTGGALNRAAAADVSSSIQSRSSSSFVLPLCASSLPLFESRSNARKTGVFIPVVLVADLSLLILAKKCSITFLFGFYLIIFRYSKLQDE